MAAKASGRLNGVLGGRCVPLDEHDFRKRPHVPLSGWPFDGPTLQPFYERAQSLVEAGVYDYSASTALRRRGTLIEGFRDPNVLTEGLERFSPPTNFWKRYRAELAKSTSAIVMSWLMVMYELVLVKSRIGAAVLLVNVCVGETTVKPAL